MPVAVEPTHIVPGAAHGLQSTRPTNIRLSTIMTPNDEMPLSVFIRLRARGAQRPALLQAIGDVVTATRQEADCLHIEGFQAIRSPDQFHIYSRWTSEAAFDRHAQLPHTKYFLMLAAELVDGEVEVSRARTVRGL